MRRSRFAKALALIKPHMTVPLDGRLWCLFRLGMYQSVVTLAQTARAPLALRKKGLAAKAVSLAACGQIDAAAQVLTCIQEQFQVASDTDFYHTLADHLAPFAPKLALALLESIAIEKRKPALYTALLMRCGQNPEAQTYLLSLDNATFRSHPELYLMRSNAFGCQRAEALELLNAFLISLSVPPVRLKPQALELNTLSLEGLDVMPSLAASYNGSSITPSPKTGPLVTVLMTAFNAGERLDTAIASVLQQSYRSLELIVVDDGSSDDSLARAQAWAQQDVRVRVLALPQNAGTYVAKTMGLELAQGEFVTCHDADDWSHPLKIARQMQPLLADTRLVATTSCWVRLSDAGTYYTRQVHPLMRLNPSSPLFRRKLILQKCGAWDLVRTGADSEFLARLKLVFGSKRIKHIRQPLTFGAHRDDSLMTASDTGYNEQNFSPTRLAYWEAWSAWHIECLRKNRLPRLPNNMMELLANRAFEAPKSIQIPFSDWPNLLTFKRQLGTDAP